VRRYLNELADHLADLRAEEEKAGRNRSDAHSAALVRLGDLDELASAMVAQPRLRSWTSRAPWATFGLGPLVALACSYGVACLILWSGWRVFLPGAETPFVRLGGVAILYFGVGKCLYFCGPVLIGWAIGLVATRQRLRAAWPCVGLVLTAAVGAAAQIHVTRPSLPGGVGNIRMDLSLGSTVQGVSYALMHAAAIFSFAMLPWLVFRLQRARLSSH
jgi:hypothetical protein